MREVEKKINDFKNEHYDDLTRPVCAFITFEEEDAYIIAQNFEPKTNWLGRVFPSHKQLLNQDLYFTEATEPTNIIWENRHVTKKERFKRYSISVLIILVLIILSFIGVSLMKTASLTISNTWDASGCTTLEKAYGTDFVNYAFMEYYNYTANEDGYTLTGVLQCFCDKQDAFSSGYTTDDTEYTNTVTNNTAQICVPYSEAMIASNVLS